MTFQDILSAVYDDTKYSASPANEIVTRIRRFVNEGLSAVLAEPGLGRLADTDVPHTFASVVSQARYTLPGSIARIAHISERTNDWSLTPMDLGAYRRIEPDPTNISGTPTHYVPIGRVGVATSPSNASELFIKSTSASDTGSVYLEGTTTGGYPRSVAVTMTGTTAVSLGATITDWVDVLNVYLSSPAVGTVTLHEDSGAGTELTRILPNEVRGRYYGLYLWPTPAAVVTYYVDARREQPVLSAPSDEPPLPLDVHPMLVAYAAWREWEHKGDGDRAGSARGRYEKWLSQLKFSTQSLPDDALVMGRRRGIGHSRLGPWYPADSWRG